MLQWQRCTGRGRAEVGTVTVNWTDLQWQAAESVWFADASWCGRWRSAAMSAGRSTQLLCSDGLLILGTRWEYSKGALGEWRRVFVVDDQGNTCVIPRCLSMGSAANPARQPNKGAPPAA